MNNEEQTFRWTHLNIHPLQERPIGFNECLILRDNMKTIDEAMSEITAMFWTVQISSLGEHHHVDHKYMVKAYFVPHPKEHHDIFPFSVTHDVNPHIYTPLVKSTLGGMMFTMSGNDLRELLNEVLDDVVIREEKRVIFYNKRKGEI